MPKRTSNIHTLHEGHKNDKCKFCDKFFSQSHSQHLKRQIHTIQKDYKCESCNNVEKFKSIWTEGRSLKVRGGLLKITHEMGNWKIPIPKLKKNLNNVCIATITFTAETLFVGSTDFLNLAIRRLLCLMKWPTKTLQNLTYFLNSKSHIVFYHFSSCQDWL